MADFRTAFAITNGNEGGWQNDPHDRGNDKAGRGTYKGIASAMQPSWKGWRIIEAAIKQMGPQPQYGSDQYRKWVRQLDGVLAGNADLQKMVEDFYRVNFWQPNHLGDLTSQELANKVYDCGVNQGTGTAAKILQACLGVEIDGCIGPVTIAAANKKDCTAAFRDARIAKYRELVRTNPKYAQYLETWIGRC